MPKPTGVLDEAFYARCIEIQIDERGYDDKRNAYGSSLHKTGAVYNLLPARQWASKVISPRFSPSPGYWNAFEVLVEDNHVTVKLNDRLVTEGILPPNIEEEGFIGLQCHSDIVQFRNIGVIPRS